MKEQKENTSVPSGSEKLLTQIASPFIIIKNMKHLITLCLNFIILISCSSKPSQSATIIESESEENEDTFFRVIDLANNMNPCDDSLLLSDIVRDVEYVKLETTDDCLVGELNNGYVCDSAIFYTCYGGPWRPHIFMFHRSSGKFIRTLGKSGQGPGEMFAPSAVKAKDGQVYLSSHYRDGLFAYKINNGEFVRYIPLNRPHASAPYYYIGDNRVVHFPFMDYQNYTMYDMSIQDFDGNLIKEQIPDIDYTGFDNNNRPGLKAQPPVWSYKNCPNVYPDFTDTIYAAIDDSIRPRYLISLGKYDCPPELKAGPEWKKYIIFDRFWETKEYLLGSFCLKQKGWFFRYDKKSKEIKTWEQDATIIKVSWLPNNDLLGWRVETSAGITNDIDGCSNSLRAMEYISERQFVICITTDNVDKIRKIVAESPNVKFPEKRKRLLELMDSLGPDDNPILAIYTLKD